MKNDELKTWILNHLYKSDKTLRGDINNITWWEKRKFESFYQSILLTTKFLPCDISFSTRIHCILNNIDENPKCPICNSDLPYRSTLKNFQTTCSYKCGYAYGNERRKCTNIKKFGTVNPAMSEIVQDKMKKTNLEKYGAAYPLQNKTIREKGEQTCLKKYGRKNPSGIKDVVNKRKHTNLKKFGVEYPAQSEQVKLASNERRLARYGNSYINEHNSHLPEESIRLLSNKDWLFEQHVRQKKTLTDIAAALQVDKLLVSRYCCKHEIEVVNYLHSAQEKELLAHIKSVYAGQIFENDRSAIAPKELDIYLPDKQLAIEYNGLFWHSYNCPENMLEKKYHLNKLNECQDKGIQLIQIFENEWLQKPKIVKSILATKFGICEKKLFARNCQVRQIASKEANAFLVENHLQGKCNSSHNMGLYFGSALVSLMTFSKPRFSKKYEWELTRYCSKLGTIIVGGSSKLFKFFVDHVQPTSIVSYSDKRYFSGKFYENLNFRLENETAPNYFYFKLPDMKLYSRNKFQKYKLPKLLGNFDLDLTEAQNMFNNGYRRIWDCGNFVYTWHK